MSNLGDWLENQIINFYFRKDQGGNFTRPNAIYVSLHTALPDESGSPSYEIAAAEYQRRLMVFSDPAGSGMSSNTSNISFPTAQSNWGTITHWALWDGISGGNMLMAGEADTTVVVNTNDVYQISAGALVIAFD